MKHLFQTLFLVLISCASVFSQSTIKGKIVDDKGESLIGVVVMLKSGKPVVTSTDIDGAYSLKLESQRVQVITVSFLGYQTISDTLFLKNGEERLKNYIMSPVSVEIQDVQVIGRAKKSDDKYMESVKAKSVSTIDFISSATMKRTGDANVVAAVGRVSGVSTNGSFISVRGIGDRYVKTTINGSRIPTLDPLTNNIKLDLFPSSLVDNIILTKTPTADLPGDWAGAYISIETKDYPDKLTVNLETSFGYNNQTSFKNILSSERSNTDWLGYDSGLRNYDHNSYTETNANPTAYDEFIALGLGDYLKSLGVTSADKWLQNSNYQRLCLVQLGLLDKSMMNDDAAYKKANDEFQVKYYNKAFDRINSNAVNSNKGFKDNWGSTTRKAPLNSSQSFSIGNQTLLFGKTLGYLVGFKYSSSTQYDPNSTGGSRVVQVLDKGVIKYDSLSQKASKETNSWSGLVNLTYVLNKNNKVALLFMPNIIGTNNVKDISKFSKSQNGYDNSYNTYIYYEQRKQMIYQFKSEHTLPGLGLKIDCNASYTNGISSIPDYKNATYKYDASNNKIQGDGERVYRDLAENIFDGRINFELPIQKNSELSRKLKFGGNYQHNDRNYDQYSYTVKPPEFSQKQGISYTSLENYSIDSALSTDGLNFMKHKLNKWYEKDLSPFNSTIGYSDIKAGFLLLDYTISKSLRFSGGLRAEHATIFTDVRLFHELNLAVNDSRRYNSDQAKISNPGNLKETSILPSASLLYKIIKDETPLNLKLNYAKTVARPSIRELTDISSGDYELNAQITGNPNLKMVRINNYDVRLEYTVKKGDNLSFNFFYKDFKNHIELTDLGYLGSKWLNDPSKSWLRGVEFEGKKTIIKNLELRANVALVKSQSTYINSSVGDTIKHPMYGQAPYIINTMLSYSSDSLKMTISLSYNVQGSRLVTVGGNGQPDTYERPRHLFDIKISKSLGKHFSASFTVKDILNSPIKRTYKYNGSFTHDYDVYHYGTTYNFALSYKL